MFEVMLKWPLFKSFYYLRYPRILPINYTISLTYNCNSKCSTCNIYKRRTKDMSVDEFKRVFSSLKKSPYWVTFSGGEPFLRKDLPQIINACYDLCQPKIINIPTNGILTHKIKDYVKAICQHCEKAQIIVNLSIDGIDEEHDKIRNVKGNYSRAINSYRELKKLKMKNLSVGIHSVISRYNVDNFTCIANTLMNLEPDQYITEIAEERQELHTIGMRITPELIKYKAAADFLIHRIKHTDIKKSTNKIAQAFRIEYYNFVKDILRDKKQIIPCYSGIASAQIAPNGDVWVCCVKGRPLGNLRKSNYNFSEIWKNIEFRNERKSIRRKECYCPLANSAYTNMLLDIKTLFRVSKRLIIERFPFIQKMMFKTKHSRSF